MTTKPPLLFVHGAWHGAWCWEEHFTGYFEGLGYRVHTLDLRGHGAGSGPGRLPWHSIADYVADVEEAVERIGEAPVIIGHSMGGFVLQRYLEAHRAAGAVLVASVPPRGVLGVITGLGRVHPARLARSLSTFDLYPIVAGPERTREMFYSESLEDDLLARYSAALGNESYRAFLDMLVLNRPRPARIRGQAPMLVLGGTEDRIFPPDDVRATAAAYGTTARFFSGMAHNLMLEDGWEQVADAIAEWLPDVVNAG